MKLKTITTNLSDMENVQYCFPCEVPEDFIKKEVSAKTVFEVIQRTTGVTIEELKGKSRKMHIKESRHIAMWCLYNLCGHTFDAAGFIVGSRDHTTAMHSNRTVANWVKTDPVFKKKFQKIIDLL